MLFGQGLASLSLALQPSHNPSLTDLGHVPKNIFSLRAHLITPHLSLHMGLEALFLAK